MGGEAGMGQSYLGGALSALFQRDIMEHGVF